MNIKTTCACRGDGRAYISVRVTNFHDGSRLRLKGFANNGNMVPTQMYVLDETKCAKTAVLVFPLSSCTINLLLSEVDTEGHILNEAPLSMHPDRLKWISRINYRLKKDECAQIRDIDETDFFRHATIEVNDCVPSKTWNTLRGTITLPTADPIPYTLTLMDGHYSQIDTSYVITSDSTRPKTSQTPTPLRLIDFSMRIPKTIAPYTIHFVDESGTVRSNFAAIEPDLYSGLLNHNRIKTLNASQDPRYGEWIKKRAANGAIKNEQRLSAFDEEPLISIVVPLFKTPIAFFREMCESVLNQTYGHFELILVNADPENDDLSQSVSEIAKQDTRVVEKKLDGNFGISLNTAEGIKASKGSYVAFLDHDDTIEPNALYEYVNALNHNPETDLFYCDEDKLFPDESYGDPYFKPDYSPHLIREINYICHFLMLKKSLLEQMRPADPKFDGAQDHRIILQALALGAQVHHTPVVLYHWRISEGSTASGSDKKPYADEAGRLAINEYFEMASISARAIPTEQACRYRIEYSVEGNPLVSIVIPNKDNADVLDVCVSSILNRSTYDNYEIVIVENNSTDPKTFDYYNKLSDRDPRIRIVTWEHEFNFSKLMNFGFSHAQGDYLLLLNNDTEVISPSWIETMLGICQEEEVGIVGAKLYYRDETIQHAGVYVQGSGAGHLNVGLDRCESGYFNTAITTHEVSAVTAACLMVKRAAFEQAGGFSEKYAVAFNDVDFCLKVRELGYSVVFSPQTELYHYESLSRGYETTSDKQIRFHREASTLHADWPKYYVLGDPFMNPNLHPDRCHYKLNEQDYSEE